MTNASGRRRALIGSLVGNTIEFYDFFIYANAAALVLGPLFFPPHSPSTQRLAVWASFALAFLARPLGALFFGHFGDKLGRRRTLAWSLLLMGTSTVCIGLLPTYEQIGWAAPALLCILRVAQGFGLGGEWGGAMLMVVESAPDRRRGWLGAIPQLGAPLGLVLANGAFVVLEHGMPAAHPGWQWRVPFLASGALVALGLLIRRRLADDAGRSSSPARSSPISHLFRCHYAPFMIGTVGAVLGFVLFYLCTTYMLAHATASMHLARQTVLLAQAAGALAMAAGILAGGRLALRFGANRCMAGSVAAALPLGPLVPWAIASGSLIPLAAYIMVALFTMGLSYGVLGAWLPSRFPKSVRYTGTSAAFALAGVLGGALTPLICELLVGSVGVTGIAWYVSITACLSLVAILIGNYSQKAG